MGVFVCQCRFECVSVCVRVDVCFLLIANKMSLANSHHSVFCLNNSFKVALCFCLFFVLFFKTISPQSTRFERLLCFVYVFQFFFPVTCTEEKIFSLMYLQIGGVNCA